MATIEFKLIDDNTALINGKTFKAQEGEAKNGVKYTVEYVRGKKIAIQCDTPNEWDVVLHLLQYNFHYTAKWNTHEEKSCISCCDEVYADTVFYTDEKYTIIPASLFIEHNQPATVEQAEPKWCESFEMLAIKNNSEALISLKEDGLFYHEQGIIGNPLDKILSWLDNGCTIHRIRNKQSGEVFVVGGKAHKSNPLGVFDIDKIELRGGELFIISGELVFDAGLCVPLTEAALPTLQEVFKKVQPGYLLDETAKVFRSNVEHKGTLSVRSQMSTEAQVLQLQAYIALRNIADYYNGEVEWKPNSRDTFYAILKNDDYIDGVEVENYIGNCIHIMIVPFKQREHAENAIAILKEAGLLEALKG